MFRNEKQIDAELDLHGCKSHEATILIENFLQDAIINNWKIIHIIVGKGINSKNGPVLPNIAKIILNKYGYLYSYADDEYGGEGVIEINMPTQ